jgi:transmembrane sensor
VTVRGEGEGPDRVAEASEWFARLHGPDAKTLRDAFEAWQGDAENRRAYREIAAIWDIAGASEYRPLPPVVAPRPRHWQIPSLIAAGLGGAAVLGMLVVEQSLWRPGAQEMAYASAPHAIREVVLSDGSHATLGAASRMLVAIASDQRRVTLVSGQARFAVAHDTVHPFIVLAGDYAIVARGTVFDVRLDRGTMEVRLLEGAVDLEQRAGDAAPRIIGRLRPGESAKLAPRDPMPHITSTPPVAWATGILAGEAMRLGDLVAAANRTGGAQIVLATPDLADLHVSGGIRPSDAQPLAASLAAALDLALSHAADGSLVLGRRRGAQSAAANSCASGSCPHS